MKLAPLAGLLLLTASACTPSSPSPAPLPVTAAQIEASAAPNEVSAPPSAAPIAAAPSAAPAAVARPGVDVKHELGALGKQALAALERHDARAFARLVHPNRGLDLGVLGTINHHVASTDVEAAFHDAKELPWDGRSNAADSPQSISYEALFQSIGSKQYSKASTVGYGEIVQEDGLCGGNCVTEEVAAAFPGLPFIQYAYPTESPGNPGMWYFLVIAFDRDGDGWKVSGLLEDTWSP